MKTLTNKQIADAAPAAVSVGRDETRTSDLYHTISTLEATELLRGQGYQVTGAQQMFARKKDNRFTRHMLIFTHKDHLADDKKDRETTPRILMLNSHNGTTSLRLEAGFYRFVCANGLVIGRAHAKVRVRHSEKGAGMLIEQLENVAETLTRTAEVIDEWKAKKLSHTQMIQFANRAAQLRTGQEKPAYDPENILKAQRSGDNKSDLWHVFNNVQENLVQGKVNGVNANGRQVSLRALTNIRKNVEFNQSLWDLAAETAAAAA